METLWPHPQRQRKTPANMAIEFYFLKRCFLTLVRNLDILYVATSSLRDHPNHKRLKNNNEEDFEVLRLGWRQLTERILEAGDTMHSFEDNAERH